LSILTFGGWYMRDQYGYQPKMTQTAYWLKGLLAVKKILWKY
jgi:hypothetical protein